MHRMYFFLSCTTDPPSNPYISGDTFRSLASRVYDAHATFLPADVVEKEVIFVGFSHLQKFFDEVHPAIKHRYILITHNGDITIDKTRIKYMDRKIIHWFSQNVAIKHSKLTPIPIGIENLDYYNHGILSFLMKKRKTHGERKSRILFGFSIMTNPLVRKKAVEELEKLETTDKIVGRLNAKQYSSLLSSYMFVASPPGNGIDCHRTWEALYMGVIPIVLRSKATEYFFACGLPIILVDNWSDLTKYSQKDLENIYRRMKKKFNSSALWISYWKEKIDSIKRDL